MKKIFLSLLFISITALLYSQTLFTYGKYPVSKNEFLQAYNKNKTATTDKAQALREYLDLYINFRLKVKAAKDMRLDTIASLNADLQNFKNQITDGYLIDNKALENLIQEAFLRSQEDLHISYLFIKLDPSEYNDQKILNEVKQSLSSGETFENIAKKMLAKNITASVNDLGYVSAFSLPYRFENIVYNLRTPGAVSKAHYENNGYHFFKLLDKRTAAGKIKAAQILIALPEGAKEEEKNKAQKIADSVYNLLLSGADFGELAKKISDDKITYLNGGLMPEFGVGKFDPRFEEKVFALEKNGDFTRPFLTAFGFHIVKKISHSPVANNIKDAETYAILKQKVEEDERGEIPKEKFVLNKLGKMPLKHFPVNYDSLKIITDSFIANPLYKIPPGKISAKTIFYSIGTIKVSVAQWLKFAAGYKATHPDATEDEMYPRVLLQKQVAVIITDYFRYNLEDFSPEYKQQVQEFKEGNILFEAMQRNVWEKATNDTVGLQKFYTANKNKYTWNESADAIVFSGNNEKVTNDALLQIKNGESWHRIADENVNQLQADSGRYEIAQLALLPNTKAEAGLISQPVNNADGTSSFVKIIKLYPANQQRSFSDGRGMVINDYQNYLEEKWILALKKKYPVKVNEKVFKSLL